MSITDTRAALAAALSTVDGVTGYEDRPSTAGLGDAWPQLVSIDRADGFTFYISWKVLIVLPTDPRTAGTWLDQHANALVGALNPVIFVDRMEPVGLTAENTGQALLEITGRGD